MLLLIWNLTDSSISVCGDETMLHSIILRLDGFEDVTQLIAIGLELVVVEGVENIPSYLAIWTGDVGHSFPKL